jgi:hypothetical protein
MTDRAVAAPSRSAEPAWAFPVWVVVAAALYVVVLSVGPRLLNDPDTYWHVAVGQWTLAHGVPTADPFSFTFAGRPWIAKEWLSQIVLALASSLGGWAMVVTVTAASAALAFGLLARALGEKLAPIPTLIFVTAAFTLSTPHLLARPHVLALPVMVAWVAGLARAADGGRRPPYALLALMVLWVNLHAGFPLGILMVAAFGLDAVVSAAPGDRLQTARGWAGFGALSVVAATITPYGVQPMLVAFQILNLGPVLSIIGEWQSADFGRLTALEAVMLGGVGLALWRGFTLPPVRVLILLGLVHLALSSERNGEVLGLLAPLVIAVPLAAQFASARTEGVAAPVAGGMRPWTVAAVLVPVTLGFALVQRPQPAANITPAAAVAAMTQVNASRVLNDYGFGGYLIAKGVPTFIDGRTELYGGGFALRHDRAVTLADLNDLLRMLDEFAIDATLLAPSRPSAALLDRLPGWKRLYADDVAVVHVRAPK